MKRRNTIQRELVFNALTSFLNHPTADEVYNFLKQNHPSISRATIYRNLNLLALEGKITKIEMPEGPDRFDFRNNKHYHFYCVKCGKIYDIDINSFGNILKDVEKSGFNILSHDISLKGICKECQKIK